MKLAALSNHTSEKSAQRWRLSLLSLTGLLVLTVVIVNAEGLAVEYAMPSGSADTDNARKYVACGDMEFERAHFSEAKLAYESAIALSSEIPEGWIGLGVSLDRLGKYSEAINACRRAIGLRPSNIAPYLAIAQTMLNIGRAFEAGEYARVAVRLKPESAVARSTLGTILLNTGKAEEAELEFKEALRLCPTLISPKIGLVCIKGERGQSREEEEGFRQLLKEFPTSTSVREAFGRLLVKWGRDDEALEQLGIAAKASDASPMTHFEYASVLARQGKITEAETEYRTAIDKSGGLPIAQDGLAWLLITGIAPREAAKNGWGSAEKFYREAITISPRYAPAYKFLGYALIADSNRWMEASAMLRKSVDLGDNDPSTPYRLGLLMEDHGGDRNEIITFYKKALDGFLANGQTNSARQVEAKLKGLTSP